MTSPIISLALLSVSFTPAMADSWKPVPGKITTTWGEKIDPTKVHQEYPRPQLVRKDWVNLNGLWDYAITEKHAAKPDMWDGKILVPFCIESALSGVGKSVSPDQKLWYHLRTDKLQPISGKKWLLHFGAVDWHATVFVNGNQVVEHKGGYDPFSADITEALQEGENEIVVAVLDPTDASYIPRGKQVRNPHGIWYTSVTGIWQTVWAEPVPRHNYITDVQITPNFSKRSVEIELLRSNPNDDIAPKFIVSRNGKEIAAMHLPSGDGESVQRVVLPLPVDAAVWSPEDPVLYDLRIIMYGQGGLNSSIIDEVESYFAFREIKVAKDATGINRLFLNGQPYFQYGPLDQGWWPDGLYTAPSDEALKFDIEMTKKWGMNMLRKHVKVEPARFYYHCDTLGMLVWQDMPSGDKYIGPNDPDIVRTKESAENFEQEWSRIIANFKHFPSIVMWVPFNEGWGQYDTQRIAELTKKLDPTRLVNAVSGWADRDCGDVRDMHNYPGPGMFPIEENRASVLGEFGGLGLPVPRHTWIESDKNWGYRTFKDERALGEAYVQLLAKLRPLIARGLSAAVYTQTTDVEVEVNGLMTYDRKVIKFPAAALEPTKKLYLPPMLIKTLVPTSETAPQNWRYTLEKPVDGWEKQEFDASAWKEGPGGFGNPTTPGSKVGTEWNTENIWLRRDFELTSTGEGLQLRLHHDEDAIIYLNGIKAAALEGFATAYSEIPISPEAYQGLKPGKNTLAIHCKQTRGGQYIDVGIVQFTEQNE